MLLINVDPDYVSTNASPGEPHTDLGAVSGLRHGVARRRVLREGVADMKFHFRTGAKVCSMVIMVLLVIGAVGPANWTPRTALGWQIDHFVGYFAITLLVCLAWPRPFVVGGILMAAAFLLEGLQALTPDRSANLVAALCGAGGVLAAALVAEIFIRAWRWHLKSARDAK
jgi:VanZ family protein